MSHPAQDTNDVAFTPGFIKCNTTGFTVAGLRPRLWPEHLLNSHTTADSGPASTAIMPRTLTGVLSPVTASTSATPSAAAPALQGYYLPRQNAAVPVLPAAVTVVIRMTC
ncbi:hypothetical protein LQQ57_07855 [Escherichia coli]|nr:hypothetical protein [Escherichia coli]